MLQEPYQGRMLPVQQQGVPFDVHQLLNTYQLGTPIKEYTNSAGSKMLLGVVFIVTGIIFIIAGLLLLLLLFSPGASSAVLAVIAGVISLVVTGLALFINYGVSLIRRAQRNRGAQVFLCTDGLLSIKDREAKALRWDQIAQVWKVFNVISYNYGQKAYVLRQFLLRRSDGTALVLDNAFHGFKEMGVEVEQKVVGRLLPGALAAYHAGNAVSFGPISVHSQGMSVNNGQKVLSWHELNRIKMEDGLIHFKGHSLFPLASVPIAQVPNACVFAALVSAVTNGQKIQLAREASARPSTRESVLFGEPYPLQPPQQAQQQWLNYQQPQRFFPSARSVITWSDKAVAALGYLSPTLGVLIVWPLLALIVFLLSRKKHFARYHFMQSLLFSIISISILFTLASIHINVTIGRLSIVLYWIISLIFVMFVCQGKYVKIPLIGRLSEKFANKRLDAFTMMVS